MRSISWTLFLFLFALVAQVWAVPVSGPTGAAPKSQQPVPQAEAAPAAAQPEDVDSVLWLKSYTEGREKARADRLPILLDFRADWCAPCRMMESQTFSDPAIRKLLKQFVCIQVDVDRDSDVAMTWRISSIPRLVAVNVHGQVVGDSIGFVPSEELAPILQEALAHANELLSKESEVHPDLDIDRKPLSEQVADLSGDALTSVAISIVALPDPKARREGLDALRPQAERLVPVFKGLLGHARLAVRVGAMEALEVLGKPTGGGYDPWAGRQERTEAYSRLLRGAPPSAAGPRRPSEKDPAGLALPAEKTPAPLQP